MISQVYTPTGEVADTAAYLANVLGAREAAGRIYLARAERYVVSTGMRIVTVPIVDTTSHSRQDDGEDGA